MTMRTHVTIIKVLINDATKCRFQETNHVTRGHRMIGSHCWKEASAGQEQAEQGGGGGKLD